MQNLRKILTHKSRLQTAGFPVMRQAEIGILTDVPQVAGSFLVKG